MSEASVESVAREIPDLVIRSSFGNDSDCETTEMSDQPQPQQYENRSPSPAPFQPISNTPLDPSDLVAPPQLFDEALLTKEASSYITSLNKLVSEKKPDYSQISRIASLIDSDNIKIKMNSLYRDTYKDRLYKRFETNCSSRYTVYIKSILTPSIELSVKTFMKSAQKSKIIPNKALVYTMLMLKGNERKMFIQSVSSLTDASIQTMINKSIPLKYREWVNAIFSNRRDPNNRTYPSNQVLLDYQLLSNVIRVHGFNAPIVLDICTKRSYYHLKEVFNNFGANGKELSNMSKKPQTRSQRFCFECIFWATKDSDSMAYLHAYILHTALVKRERRDQLLSVVTSIGMGRREIVKEIWHKQMHYDTSLYKRATSISNKEISDLIIKCWDLS